MSESPRPALDTADVQSLCDLASARLAAGQSDEAESLYRQALALQPQHLAALSGLSEARVLGGDSAEALALIQRALQLHPREALGHAQLGAVLSSMSRIDDAIAAYRQALSLRPIFPAVWNNLGDLLREKGRIPEAIIALRQAFEQGPTIAKARWNLAWALLLSGDFANGWKFFESRWNIPEIRMHRELKAPLWDGSPLNGRRLLLHAEQGWGDTIQFARYFPIVQSRGGDAKLLCQPELRRLLAHNFGNEAVAPEDQPPPMHDLQFPLMSLPGLLGTTLQRIPADVPYLRAEPDGMAHWAKELSPHELGLKVGLAWAGRPSHTRDRTRSIPLKHFAPLAAIKNARWISLQKGEAARQPPPAGMPLVDLTDRLTDFADTAALIANLDLVICVDTAAAHLAGAMGKPVWVLIPFAPDWRWLMHRERSPWYPTMRLFRQQRPDDWDRAIAQVAKELRNVSEGVMRQLDFRS
jgi:Tfp pilus assembly protein PilF